MAGARKAKGTQVAPTFGPWVQRLIDQKGMSKVQVAEAVGVHPDYLRRVMGGGNLRVELLVFEGLAKVLNLDLGFVLYKAGVDIGKGGADMDRVARAESVAQAFGEIENACRAALSETAALLDGDSTVEPLEIPELRAHVARGLVVLDQAVSRLRAEGYISAPGAIQAPVAESRTRSAWTADEDRMLMSGLDDLELVRRLGRSIQGIRARKVRLAQDAAISNDKEL